MNTTTALIVDDEPLARRKIRDLLAEVAWIECLGEAADGRAALRAIAELQPDLLFLDIKMPGLSGLDLLNELTTKPAVIFTTAFERYAVTAFEVAAADYLVKPFSRERFLAAVERARPSIESSTGSAAIPRVKETLTSPRATRLFVRDGISIVSIRVPAIQHVEACDDFVWVYAQGKKYRLSVPLNDLELRLDPAHFLRVHRSFLVNLDHVERFLPYDGARFEVRLRDGTTIVASRQRSRLLRELSS